VAVRIWFVLAVVSEKQHDLIDEGAEALAEVTKLLVAPARYEGITELESDDCGYDHLCYAIDQGEQENEESAGPGWAGTDIFFEFTSSHGETSSS